MGFHYSLFWATIMLILWLTENMSCIHACRFMLLLLWLKKMFLNVYHIWVVVIVRTDLHVLAIRMTQYKMKPSNTPDQFLRRKRMLEEQKTYVMSLWKMTEIIHYTCCDSKVMLFFNQLSFHASSHHCQVISWCGKMLLVMSCIVLYFQLYVILYCLFSDTGEIMSTMQENWWKDL